MNKAELIEALASKTDSTQKAAGEFLSAFTEIVTDELSNGEAVKIVGFGNFEVVERAAREGRNPKTSEKIMIPASKFPKFKAGKTLKDAVNK